MTFDEYSEVEDAYARAFVCFANAAGVEKLQVRGLEHGAELKEGQLLQIAEAELVLRRMLREEAWCRLEAIDESFATHVGYDFYMFIGSNAASVEAVEVAEHLGLYVEADFVSPLIPEDD